MSIKGLLQQGKTVEWATPQEVFDDLDAEFHFTLDPCATPENAKCAKFYTKEQDGLTKNWGGADGILQPTVWQRNSKVGKESKRGRSDYRDVNSGENGHEVVSRLHLR